MDYNRPSTANVRQFESTAIAKLVAEGVPRDVAHAFVTVGIVQRSQNYAQIRDAVCPMEMQEFFIPMSQRDYRDPLRLGGTGALVPRVVENRMQRFYTTFAMSDIDAVKFTKSFPEFLVVNSGKVFNSHAYYANKRYAETELLISMIRRHSDSYGGRFDHTSVVDLGGNRVSHVSRDREYVHCDNPVLSRRDQARYVVREVFSGEDPKLSCRKSFLDCVVRSQYGMGIHSTYDMSPRTIAEGMARRGMHTFFGVINILPDIHLKDSGLYEADGVTVTISKPRSGGALAKFGFRYDPSLEYTHSVHDAAQYLFTMRRYQISNPSGQVRDYVYRIHSVRGSTMIFTITSLLTGDEDYAVSDTLWSSPRDKCYKLSIPALDVSNLDVDCELFDRLVMEAAGARNTVDYDITSLYKYGKSLRQRVSINGIVLSSGYCVKPEELVSVVIAAYCVAASYRVESVDFFKRATRQIVAHRLGSSTFKTVFSVASTAVMSMLKALGSVLAKYSYYSALDDKLRVLVNGKFPVQIEVDRARTGKGKSFDPRILEPVPRVRIGTLALASVGGSAEFTPLAVGGFSDKPSVTRVVCGGVRKVFYSYGVPHLNKSEVVRDCAPVYYDLPVSEKFPLRSEQFRSDVYSTMLGPVLGYSGWSQSPLVTACGDRVYRRYPVSVSEGVSLGSGEHFVGPQVQYVVFRGVGSRAVSLGKPQVYGRGICLNFVLFYEYDELTVDGSLAVKLARRAAFAAAKVSTTESATLQDDDWSVLASVPGVVSHATTAEAREAVAADLSKGFYTMTGALPASRATPPLSPVSTPVLGASTGAGVYRAADVARSEAGDVSDRIGGLHAGSETFLWSDEYSDSGSHRPPSLVGHGGSSASVAEATTTSASAEPAVFARDSMREFVLSCVAAERVALESSLSYYNMAVAVSVGLAKLAEFSKLSQGTPGEPRIVRVRGDFWEDLGSGDQLKHMAVSDGKEVYDRIVKPPPDGVYVTSEVMRVYTGSSIKRAVEEVIGTSYLCDVVSVNGVAGSGKTHQIVSSAQPSHVVLCETSEALRETAGLLKRRPEWKGHAYTVDSFLMHRQVSECEVLWVDESFRLHAAKLYALMKILKPEVVYCFGDSKQIPVLPYIPDFDFVYHRFPFTRTELRRDSWRCPADVCLALSTERYYNFQMTTHREVARSMRVPEVYDASLFLQKPSSVVLLVYTQAVKADLRDAGVTNVMTIGESQGKTFDSVILWRDKPLRKALYYDEEQTLVAVTRHRVQFRYVTNAIESDDSFVMDIYRYLQVTMSDLTLASHMVGSGGDVDGRAVTSSDSDIFDDGDLLGSDVGA